MKTYPANKKTPVIIDAPHDPDAVLFYGFKYKPEVWQADTVYRKDKQVVIPSEFNGFEYPIDSNGKSGSVEPAVWPTEKDGKVDSGTVRFKAVEYKSFLGELETLTASAWEATDSVPITNETYDVSGTTQAMFGPIPADVTSFTITNRVTKSNGEKDDRSMIINVSER